ncbi:hypothetical protein HDU97_001243 [Phlyctochytrium planicorne]|nr:hypothetical protein HDU97_001243 [Phlyctochytrium planicorne]
MSPEYEEEEDEDDYDDDDDAAPVQPPPRKMAKKRGSEGSMLDVLLGRGEKGGEALPLSPNSEQQQQQQQPNQSNQNQQQHQNQNHQQLVPANSSNFYLEEEAFSGFRGIALSLQRKLRHNVHRSVAGQGERNDGSTGDTRLQGEGNEDGDVTTLTAVNDQDDLVVNRINNDNGEITIIEDLSSDTILFYGRTSTTTSAAWRQSPRFAKGIMSISLSFEAAEKDTPMVEPPPCSPDLVHHLVSLYFDHVHPYFPMIHRPSFLRQLKSRRTEHFSFLLNSMCALVTQQCRDLSAWGITNPSELHGTFFERARVLLGRQLDWPHINNVQAMLLLCMVGQGTNINASSYHYIGIAHRQAVELGMHRNLDNLQHPQLDLTLRETMRVTWFCLYVLDRYTSVVEGRPMAISDDDWDTPFPSGTGRDIVNLASHVSLCEILGHIAKFVNRPGRPGPQWQSIPGHRSTPAPNPKQVISDINAMLGVWFSTLPEHLASPPTLNVPWTFHHHIHAMYHTATVLLHRLDVGTFDESCTQSAVHISHLLSTSLPLPLRDPLPSNDATTPTFVFVMPLIVYSALTSATLFLDAMLAKSDLGPWSTTNDPKPLPLPVSPSQKVTSADLKRGLIAFEKLRDTSLFASYYRQLIVEVLRSHGVVIEGVPELESSGAGKEDEQVPQVGEPAPTDEQSKAEKREDEVPVQSVKTESISQPFNQTSPRQQPSTEAGVYSIPASQSGPYPNPAQSGFNDPAAQLRAAAKAAVAAAAASQAAASLRAARHGIPTPIPQSDHVAIPSGAAVPRASHFRMAATAAGIGGLMPFQPGNIYGNVARPVPVTEGAGVRARGMANISGEAARAFARGFPVHPGLAGGIRSAGEEGTDPMSQPPYGLQHPKRVSPPRNGHPGVFPTTTLASQQDTAALLSPNGTNPGNLPPFFGDSVFSDLLNPFVDYSIWHELGQVMGGGGFPLRTPPGMGPRPPGHERPAGPGGSGAENNEE